MKWSVKHVDLITTVVDVDMARSSLRDHDHDHDLRRRACDRGAVHFRTRTDHARGGFRPLERDGSSLNRLGIPKSGAF